MNTPPDRKDASAGRSGAFMTDPASPIPPPAIVKSTFWHRHRAILISALVLGVGLVAFGIRFLIGPAVKVVRVRRSDIVQTVVTSGRVMAAADIKLAVQVAGTVWEVLVREGDAVTPGQPLLRLSASEAAASVAQARAALEETRVRQRRVSKLSAPLAAQKARQAEIERDDADRALKRAGALFRGGAISQKDADDAQRAALLARSHLAAARLQEASASSGGLESKLASAESDQAEAMLREAQARLGHSELFAPAHGIVVQRDVEVGDSVQPGRVLLVIARTGPTRLVVEPDERNLALLKVGQTAIASADAFPESVFDAKVDFIAPAVNAERGTIEVRLAVAKPPDFLRSEMTASVEITVGRRAQTLVVPLAAVQNVAGDTPWVLTIKDHHVQRSNVRLGLRGSEQVEIQEGVVEGAWVVLDSVSQRLATLKPGRRVRPKP